MSVPLQIFLGVFFPHLQTSIQTFSKFLHFWAQQKFKKKIINQPSHSDVSKPFCLLMCKQKKKSMVYVQLTRGRKKYVQRFLFWEQHRKTTAPKQNKQKKKTPKSKNMETYIAKLLSNRIWAYPSKVSTMPLCHLSSASKKAFDTISNKHTDYTARRDLQFILNKSNTTKLNTVLC